MKRTITPERRAYAEGVHAWRRGDGMGDNPYERMSIEWRYWDRGYNDAWHSGAERWAD